MSEIRRILIPTDLSELATHALRYAHDLARVYHAELHVLHVVSPAKDASVMGAVGAGIGSNGGVSGTMVVESIASVMQRRAAELARSISDFGRDLTFQPLVAVRCGAPSDQIVLYADEIDADLIVIGSHARGVMKRIWLGSTSKDVLEHAARPILMVPIQTLPSGDSARVANAVASDPREASAST